MVVRIYYGRRRWLTARVSGLVGEPATETEKAPRPDGGFFAARTTKSACTHCWAQFWNCISFASSRLLQKRTTRQAGW